MSQQIPFLQQHSKYICKLTCFTVDTSEARFTVTFVAIDIIGALARMQAWRGGAFINLYNKFKHCVIDITATSSQSLIMLQDILKPYSWRVLQQ